MTDTCRHYGQLLIIVFQYWAQRCPPTVVQNAATKFDAAILEVAATCIGNNIRQDPLTLRRLRLPARMYGGGLRSVVDTTPAAFIGTICRTVPFFADRIVDGRLVRGFMPVLTRALGGATDESQDNGARLDAFTVSGSHTAQVFNECVRRLQISAGDSGSDSLQTVIRNVICERKGVQKACTKWIERACFQSLDVELRALPYADVRKAAWVNTDRFSTVWVSAWPTNELQFSSPEFREASSFYFGLPSPACAARIGENIAGRREVLDAYGARLTTLSLPGDGWRTQHDAIKWRIVQDAREMHVRARHEVFGLFAASIPQAGRGHAEGLTLRRRQGLAPDFLMHIAFEGPERPLLFELKTLHYGSSTYGQGEDRCHGVARRARGLPAEYAAKAREVDRRYCGTLVGAVGPVEATLQAYEPVRGIVFGAWGEASPATNKFLSQIAKIGAQTHWRSMRCEDPVATTGVLAWLLRRRWGLTTLRENARLKLDRLEYVGRGALAASRRRTGAADAHAARQRALAGTPLSGPRARR